MAPSSPSPPPVLPRFFNLLPFKKKEASESDHGSVHYVNKNKIGQTQSTSSCCCATTTNISTHSKVEDDTSLNNNNGADRITAHAQNQHVHQQRVCRATQPPSSSHQQQNRRASSSSPHNHHNHGHNHAHHNGGQGEGGGGRMDVEDGGG